MHSEQAQADKPVELYKAPKVEVIEVELAQNILANSNNNTLPDMPGEDF